LKGHKEASKQELIDIYNALLPPTQKKILDIARTVRNTQEIINEEYKIKLNKECGGVKV